MRTPVIFIGSSTEGLDIANTLRDLLHTQNEVHVWDNNVFNLGESYLGSLINELDKADFAILVLTEDDVIASRENVSTAPRDNVLFELGLFMGRLGPSRSYYVYDKKSMIKIPSDLSGIKGAEYINNSTPDLAACLQPACKQIQNAITSEGIRNIIPANQLLVYNEQIQFYNSITGCWWERIFADNPAEISFMTIENDEQELMLKLAGRSFDKKGQLIAYWETESVSVNFKDHKVFYKWKGRFPSLARATFGGAGEISFDKTAGIPNSGNGVFSNYNIADIKSIEMNSFQLYRAIKGEKEIMDSMDKIQIAQLVKKKIKEAW